MSARKRTHRGGARRTPREFFIKKYHDLYELCASLVKKRLVLWLRLLSKSRHRARHGYRGLRFLAATLVPVITSACSAPPQIEDHLVGDAGHIEVRKADHRVEGVVIGVTQGLSEPDAAELATVLSNETGAGLVIPMVSGPNEFR